MKPTRADEIVHSLTQSIVTHQIAPGTPLNEEKLAASFGASRTPIREALRQLAASGLVDLRPHCPAKVAVMDPARLRDMFDVMTELEALCSARAAVAMTAAQRQALERHHAAMAGTVREGDVAGYRAGNAAFHALISEGAANGYLTQLIASTRERLAPYRGLQLEAPRRLARSYAEHGEIVTAILRGDQSSAAAAMRRHLVVTQETLEVLARTEPGAPLRSAG